MLKLIPKNLQKRMKPSKYITIFKLSFIQRDLKQVRDSRQIFEKISVEMDDQLAKNAQPPRKFTGKDRSSSGSFASASGASSAHGNTGGDEPSNDLISYRTRFRFTALDHLTVVTLVQAKKRPELVNTVSFPYFLGSC